MDLTNEDTEKGKQREESEHTASRDFDSAVETGSGPIEVDKRPDEGEPRGTDELLETQAEEEQMGSDEQSSLVPCVAVSLPYSLVFALME